MRLNKDKMTVPVTARCCTALIVAVLMWSGMCQDAPGCAQSCSSFSTNCTTGLCDAGSGQCVLVPKTPPPLGCCISHRDCEALAAGHCSSAECNFNTHQCDVFEESCPPGFGTSDYSSMKGSSSIEATVLAGSPRANAPSPSSSSEEDDKNTAIIIAGLSSLGSLATLFFFAACIAAGMVFVFLRIRRRRPRALEGDDGGRIDIHDDEGLLVDTVGLEEH